MKIKKPLSSLIDQFYFQSKKPYSKEELSTPVQEYRLKSLHALEEKLNKKYSKLLSPLKILNTIESLELKMTNLLLESGVEPYIVKTINFSNNSLNVDIAKVLDEWVGHLCAHRYRKLAEKMKRLVD